MRPELAGKMVLKIKQSNASCLTTGLNHVSIQTKRGRVCRAKGTVESSQELKFPQSLTLQCFIKSAFSFNAMSIDTVHENVIIKIQYNQFRLVQFRCFRVISLEAIQLLLIDFHSAGNLHVTMWPSKKRMLVFLLAYLAL